MNFTDAVVNMVNGKRVTRPTIPGSYLAIMDGQEYIWIFTNSTKPSVNAAIYVASLDDILATDWQVKTN